MMENYLKLAKEIAEGSAEIAIRYFGFNTETVLKSDDSPLTRADTEINAFVIKKIQEKYPDHSIQGEEESFGKENSNYIWVCDPIDGTMPYSLGIPTFTFSLALVDQSDGQPILGLVNDPILKNMYWATKNGGAFRNGHKISVMSDLSLKNTYIELDGSGSKLKTGFSKTEIMDALRNKGCKIMSLLSIVYGAIQVSNGKFAGAVFLGKYAHDVAAVKIITEEAGGKVTDLKGNIRRYDQEGLGCLISNGKLHSELLDCIK